MPFLPLSLSTSFSPSHTHTQTQAHTHAHAHTHTLLPSTRALCFSFMKLCPYRYCYHLCYFYSCYRCSHIIVFPSLSFFSSSYHKVNTVSQALDISRAARKAGLAQIVGYSESGPESLDSFIADLSVAIGAGQLTAGGILSGIESSSFYLFIGPVVIIHCLDHFNIRASASLHARNLIRTSTRRDAITG